MPSKTITIAQLDTLADVVDRRGTHLQPEQKGLLARGYLTCATYANGDHVHATDAGFALVKAYEAGDTSLIRNSIPNPERKRDYIVV